MKTKEELNALKEEVEALNRKLAELTEEELAQVTGGSFSIDVTFPSTAVSRYAFVEKERFYINDGLTECVIVKAVSNNSFGTTVGGQRVNFTMYGGVITITEYQVNAIFNIDETDFRAKYLYVLG